MKPALDRSQAPVEPRARLPRATGSRSDARTVTGLARTLVMAAQARGLQVDDDLRQSGISRADLDDVDGRVPYGALMQLLDLVAARSGDAHFGLHAAEAFVEAASFGVVGFAARSSNNLREAIERTARYARLMNENTEIALHYDARGVRIVDGPIAPLEWPRHYAELAIAAFVTLSRNWTGTRFAAVEVGFHHAAPSDVGEHRRLFGVAPTFGADSNFVVIPAEVLDQKLAHGDRQLGKYFDGRLDELARALATAPGPLADVREAMLRTLSEGTPTLTTIGRRLAVSERTLQRRLGERGVTFNGILDSVRREAALIAVVRPGTSVQEAAFVCGFADVKAFRRAFRRWTGKSPRQYRRADAG